MAEHNPPGSSSQQKSSILAPRFRQNFSRRTELAGDPSFVTLTITIKDDSSRRARSRLTTFRRLVLGGRRKNLRGTQLKDKSKSILCPFAPADCPALMATALLSRSPMLQLLYPARYPETTEMKCCTAAKPVQQLSPILLNRSSSPPVSPPYAETSVSHTHMQGSCDSKRHNAGSLPQTIDLHPARLSGRSTPSR